MNNGLSDILRYQLMMKLGNNGSMKSLLAIYAYDQFSKYSPVLVEHLIKKITKSNANKFIGNPPKIDPIAKIELEKFFDEKAKVDIKSKVDSVLHFVTTLSYVKSLYYNGSRIYPNFKEKIKLDEYLYFRLTKLDFGENDFVRSIKFELYTYDKDSKYILRFIDQCHDRYRQNMEDELGEKLYFFDQMNLGHKTLQGVQYPPYIIYTKNIFHTTRTFENIFFEQKKDLENRVRFFMNNKQWYEKKGIPYTLGLLLHGDPGTGKTSTIKAIANITQRHIINIHLSDVKTKTQMKNLFYNEKLVCMDQTDEFKQKHDHFHIPIDKRIYLIEDIDAMDDNIVGKRVVEDIVPDISGFSGFNDIGGATLPSREEKKKEELDDKLDLSFILNLIDGTLEIPGRILIITTNHPEKLDPALIRPGRIDMFIKFKKCNKQIIKEMYDSFYDDDLDISVLEGVEEYKWTPAEISQMLFQNFHNKDAFIDML